METLIKSKILNLIRLHGPISRTAISDMMEISMPAIAKYIIELINEGTIKETGTDKSTGGRKPILLDMDMRYGYIICVDFGQSFLRIAALYINNEIIVKKTLPSSELGTQFEGIPKIINIINDIIKEINLQNKLLAVGIAVSGLNKGKEGTHVSITNLNGWEDADLLTPIKNFFNVPVFVDDSARMMAVCESIIPGNGRCRNLISISMGTGIGTGIIVFGRLLRGTAGMAGELGHIIVKENGNICGCGNRGCLEQYASVASMVNNTKKALSDGVRSSILEYANGNFENIDSYCIAKAIASDDKLAYNIVIEAGHYLGVGVSQLINIFNPELIIIGGGGAEISDILIEEIIRVCRIRSLNESIRNVKIVKSAKGENSALFGVSTFVQDNLFGLENIFEKSLF